MKYPELTIEMILGAKEFHTGTYTITPELARKVIAMYNPMNRHLSPRKVLQLTNDIDSGNFVLNGESIIFNNEGNLNDGQHRLEAVVEAKKPIITVVVLGAKPDAKDSVDQGRARSAGDVAAINGISYAHTVASIARWVKGYYDSDGTHFTRTGNYTNTEVVNYIYDNPRLVNICEWAITHNPVIKGIMTATQLGIVRAILEPIYGPEVEFFLDRVAIGDNISSKSPAFAARKRMQQGETKFARKNALRNSNPFICEILMRAFIAFHEKREMTHMQLIGKLPKINTRHYKEKQEDEDAPEEVTVNS